MIVSPSACSRLVSAAPWYVEPGIASGSFIVWLLFFRACELGWGFLLRAPRQPARLAVSLFRRARRWLRRHRIQDAYPIKPARPSGRRASSPDCILAPEEQERTAEERQCSREQRQRSRERERERERERASDADSIESPHAFTTHAFSSLGAYWLGILLWTRVVSPVTGAGTGCPTGAASTAQLVAEVVAGLVDTYAVSHCGVAHRPPPYRRRRAVCPTVRAPCVPASGVPCERVPCGAPQVAGLVAYDFVFFWLHVGMHLLPRVGRAVGHSQHHGFDGRPRDASEMPGGGGGGAASESAF